MSATGHQVLSFVTSGEITIDTATVTRISLVLGEITKAKDIGCVAEFVMPVFAGNAAVEIDPMATIQWKVPANTAAIA